MCMVPCQRPTLGRGVCGHAVGQSGKAAYMVSSKAASAHPGAGGWVLWPGRSFASVRKAAHQKYRRSTKLSLLTWQSLHGALLRLR